MCEFVKKNCVSKNSLSLLKYEEPLGNRNGSKTEETMHFCFFVVLPPQGQIGLTKLLDSEGQSICLLRLTLCSYFHNVHQSGAVVSITMKMSKDFKATL